ncbi:MAG: TM0106 family RecB-like putative nuclease [Nitrosomonas sp.]
MSGTTNRLLIRASDATSWVMCIRRAWFDKHQPITEAKPDAFMQFLFEAGLAHEASILKRLSEQYLVCRANSAEHTLELMEQGAQIIYQGRLVDSEMHLIGYPDFLIRDDNGQYQAADVKLSLSENKKTTQIQLGVYRRLLKNDLPAIVYLGDNRIAQLTGDDVDVSVDQFLVSMKQLITDAQPPTVRYSYSRCETCPYINRCLPEFVRKEETSLLYGVDGNMADQLAQIDISTISQLAKSDAAFIPDLPHLRNERKKTKAIVQAQSYLTGKVFQLGPIDLPEGIWIHFDIEDDPMTNSRVRHVYLWGFLVPSYTKTSFEYVWSDNESSDYQGWISFLQKIEDYRQRYTSIVIAHYSNHEKATIKKYAQRYAMENDKTVAWLLGDESPLYDLQKPILNSLILPIPRYGLKDICKNPNLVNFQWENDESGSQWSVVQFKKFQSEGDLTIKNAIKETILSYNRDDVTATRKLEMWLRELSQRNNFID